MKNFLPVLVGAALCAPAVAQTTAYTDPVGYHTITIAGSTGGTPRLTVAGLGMVQPVEFQGPISGASAATLNFSGTPFTDGAYNATSGSPSYPKFYLEVVSTGAMVDIISNATNSLTLAQALPLNANDVVRLRAHNTIGSVFGATNSAGLQGGTTSGSADNIVIFDSATKSTSSYFYSTLGSTWRSASSPVAGSVNDLPIYPDQGLLINRRGTTEISLRVVGAVAMGTRQFTVEGNGINVLANPAPVALTLAGSNLYRADGSGMAAASTAGSADTVTIVSAGGTASYYYNSVFNGWRSSANPVTDAGTTAIPVGAAVILTRRSANPFTWSLPQPF